MSAIITDQFRIFNAETFIKSFNSNDNKYYIFIGQPNSSNPYAYGNSNWGEGPPPLDGFEEEIKIKETILALKNVTPGDVRRVIKKNRWTAGRTYEMYKHDYNIYNVSPVTRQPSLYESSYYVINQDLRVYICLQNGTTPSTPVGRPTLDEPTFVDFEPRPAGTSGDGYIWKYLYTIKPSEIFKFDSIEFIPVPNDWGSFGESKTIKENAIDGKIEIVTIKTTGSTYSPSSRTYKNIPILGDGADGKVSVTVGSDGKVSEVFVTDGGRGYTKGIVEFSPGAPGIPSELTNVNNDFASFNVIIPPKGGHGYDIYRELGAYRVLVYSRFVTDESNPDTILGNDFARVGIIKNPTTYGSDVNLLTNAEVSGLKSLKLTGITSNTVYPVDGIIQQTVSTGQTAIGFVASWDDVTGVLKYYQPVGLATAGVGYKIYEFTSSPSETGNLTINGASIGNDLIIDTGFTGINTVINNRTYQLGSSFISGISSEEYNKKSGEIIYLDNRFPVQRTANQKEDIKIVLEF